MLKYWSFFMMGFMGGIFSAILIPPFLFTDSEQFISTVILSPISFLFGMVCFLIGFVANAALFRNSIELIYASFSKVKIYVGYMFLSSFWLINFILIFFLNFSVFLVFSFMTVLYGIISLNLNRHIPLRGEREEV